LLRPGVWSAPPTSTMSAGVDDLVAVRRGHSRGQGRFSVGTIDGHLRRQQQDDRLQRLLDGWHGGAQSNLYTTTRSSSFRAMPRRDADRHLHVDDATNDLVSATTPPDRSVYPRGNVEDQQSPRTGEMNSADFDDCSATSTRDRATTSTVPDPPTSSRPIPADPPAAPQYWLELSQPSAFFGGDCISATRGCCALKFLHALEIAQTLIAHTRNGTGVPQ